METSLNCLRTSARPVTLYLHQRKRKSIAKSSQTQIKKISCPPTWRTTRRHDTHAHIRGWPYRWPIYAYARPATGTALFPHVPRTPLISVEVDTRSDSDSDQSGSRVSARLLALARGFLAMPSVAHFAGTHHTKKRRPARGRPPHVQPDPAPTAQPPPQAPAHHQCPPTRPTSDDRMVVLTTHSVSHTHAGVG